MRKKVLTLVLAQLLLCGFAISGTMALLTDRTDPVVNTFTYGDINIDLDETDTKLDSDDDPGTNKYQMIPGQTIAKDPKITVYDGSKASWLFVRLDKSDNFDDFLEYEMAEGWTQLKDSQGNDVAGVFYRQVEEVTGENSVYGILKEDKVSVKDSVTKEMLNALDPAGGVSTYPTLTVTAYAIQRSGFEPEISEGASVPTDEQIAAAALLAWVQIGA